MMLSIGNNEGGDDTDMFAQISRVNKSLCVVNL